jgi:hypothetical protein
MALFSDIDWVVILAVGGFLLLGPNNQGMLRTVGRLYARAMNLKNELLGEVAKSAGLPPPNGQPISLRDMLLREPSSIDRSSIPLAVVAPPATAFASVSSLPSMVTVASSGAIGGGMWTVTKFPTDPEEVVRYR